MRSFTTKAGHLRFGYLPGISLTVIDGDSSLEEWKEMLALARAEDDAGSKVVLIWVKSGEISAEHRRAAAEDQAAHASKPPLGVALITGSIVIRGAMTAYGWLIKQQFPTRAFAPAEISEAMTWLGTLGKFDGPAALTLLETLKERGT
jgi:hypothetical protein